MTNVIYDDERMKRTIEELARAWLIDISKDYDIVNLITGDEGTGKSTFAVLIAETMKKEFNLNYAFPTNYFEFIEAVENDNIKIIIVDEAVTELNYRRAMSSENVAYIELMTMCRSRNKIMMFLIPSFFLIDVYMRARRVFHWLEVRQRFVETKSGYALWFMRDTNDFVSIDKFDTDSIEKAIKETNTSTLKTEFSEKLLREKLFYYCKNYMGHILYTVSDEIINITKQRSEIIKKQKIEQAKKELEEKEARELISDFKTKLDTYKIIKQVAKDKIIQKLMTQEDKEKLEQIYALSQSSLFYKQKYQFNIQNYTNIKQQKLV